MTYPERSGRVHLVDPDVDTAGAELAPQLRRLFELAGAIHEAAVNGDGDIRATVRELARDLIGELVDLADVVLALPGRDPAATNASKTSVTRARRSSSVPVFSITWVAIASRCSRDA